MNNSYITKVLSLFLLVFLLSSWDIEQMDPPSIYTQSCYEITLSFAFEGQGQEAILEAYIPVSDDRQHIHLVAQDLAGFEQTTQEDQDGRRLQWRHPQAEGKQSIRYTFYFSGASSAYGVPFVEASTESYPTEIQAYLEPSTSIPSGNSFIQKQAVQLAGENKYMPTILEAYYSYISHLPAQPGPALASLFYSRKDWKNYFFIALAQAKGIPARVVNGLQIESGGIYEMRQWAEVYVGGEWIPFDVHGERFAFLSDQYLTLHRGGNAAVQYSSNLSVETYVEVIPKMGLVGMR
jgi:hypothetical protein